MNDQLRSRGRADFISTVVVPVSLRIGTVVQPLTFDRAATTDIQHLFLELLCNFVR